MSRVLIPAKPDWKITIEIDTAGQPRLNVEDKNDAGAVVAVPGGAVRRVPRQMNQLELALILSTLVSSLVGQTLAISRSGKCQDRKPNEP